jgi:hypothetical protein
VLAAPTAEEDAALIAKADELLKTNAHAYFRDPELQELALEARERQQATPPPEPDRAAVADQIERQIAQRQCDKFAAMLRDPAEAGKYWASPQLQESYREAIAAAELPAPAVAPPTAPAAPEVAPPIVPEPAPPAPQGGP